MSWTSSLSISSSVISTSTLSNHVIRGLTVGLRPSTPYSLHFSFSLHHMSIPFQPTISNDSCERMNSNQLFNFFMKMPQIHLIICISALSNYSLEKGSGLTSICYAAPVTTVIQLTFSSLAGEIWLSEMAKSLGMSSIHM